MGLLNDLATKGLGALGVQTKKKVKPSYKGQDFASGLVIVEYIDGLPRDSDSIHLVGRFAPLQPFEYGGEQRIVREEYPGSSEPTVHVLGPKEGPVTIKGHLKTNKFRSADDEQIKKLRAAAEEYAQLIDAMRIRGNLVKIQLGEWIRWGFIEKSNFKIFTLQNIDYDITFNITGFNKPKGWRLLLAQDTEPIKANKDVTDFAQSVLAQASNMPAEMPLDASEIINGIISNVAEAVKKVTDFTDGIINDANKLVGSANRAIGLIKNARTTISRSKRQLGALSLSAQALSSSFDAAAKGAIGQLKSTDHVAKTIGNFSSLALLLASLQARFASFTTQTPFRRHLVKVGDTLNNISMKYYNTGDNWKKIYDHNKLSSTVLTVGSVLEIPKG